MDCLENPAGWRRVSRLIGRRLEQKLTGLSPVSGEHLQPARAGLHILNSRAGSRGAHSRTGTCGDGVAGKVKTWPLP